jgi:SSS family solute:Na+ symporter
MFANMCRSLQPTEMARVDPLQARQLGALLIMLSVLLLPLLWLADGPQGLWLHAAIALTVAIVGLALRLLAGSRSAGDDESPLGR